VSEEVNDQLMLVGGISGGGKSASLRNIRNQSRWMFLNTEAGKRLPFKNDFRNFRITDPFEVHEAFDYAIGRPNEIDGIIIDSVTFLMDMFETLYVNGSANTMKAWGDYAQFLKTLMQNKVVLFGKPVIILAHVMETLDEGTITEEDELLGFKHVFQTRITKTSTGKRIRSPMGLLTPQQTYIDNDAQLFLDHLTAFYR
jgi:hypothetical protein